MANEQDKTAPANELVGRDTFDQPVLLSEREYPRISRRKLLQLAPLALGPALLVPRVQQRFIREGLAFSDWASGKFFSRCRRAETFSNSEVVPFEKFPYNFSSTPDPGIDFEKWSLTVEGLVRRPGNYTLEQIQALPKINQNTRHICIEGWDVIGNFGGCRISEFLDFVGADANARFLEAECADDYYESIDMDSARHPQSLLCYEMYGNPLDRGHGAPLRLQMPVKLGYKQAKYLTALRVTNVLHKEKGYWEDQGYSWFGGV
jgi:DMSO/TMAO reductase YedYZ molybdopterin-dependent catalytic subunit